MKRPERVYRTLMRLYPPRFRERYGTDATELFLDRLREARAKGTPGTAWFWCRTIVNVSVHGPMERIAELRRRLGAAGPLDASGTLASAFRRLVRSPGLSLVIVLTLGVGIGANVALYSVIRTVLLRPLPYPQADRLVNLWETNPEVDDELHGPSPWNFSDWEARAGGFESMASWYLTSGTYRSESWVEEIRSAQVTVDFFRTLGVEPMLGRDFLPEEVERYGPVMLSHHVWQRLFGGDPSVVGTTITSSAQTYRIVGVMPPDFAFPDESVGTWIAWNMPVVYADRPETRTWRFLSAVGRLDDRTSIEAAEEEMDRVAAGLADAWPGMNRGWDVAVTSLHDDVVGDVRPTLWIAFGAVSFILLIACANVANLMLARVPSRAREIAIRTTLGATRGRVGWELLVENLLLGVASGGLGLCFGFAFLEALVTLDAGRIPRLAEVTIDGGVFAFTAVVALTTSVLFGLAPVVQLAGRSDGSPGVDRRTTSTAGQRRIRDAFVGSQVAIALVLLTGAALFSSSLQRLTDVDPGLDPERVGAFRVSLDPVDEGEAGTVRYYDGLVERLAEIPGVVRAGAAQTLPLNAIGNDFRRPWRPSGSSVASADAPSVQMRIVTPGYLETLGMRLVEGSTLPETPALGDPLVAIVNRPLADRLWPDGGAVGRTFEIDFREGWQPYTVVGVVEGVRHYGLRSELLPEVFLSHRQVPYLAMNLVVKTVGPPAELFDEMRAAVLSHQPMQPPHDFVSLEDLVSASAAEERFLSVLFSVLGAIGLLLATTGVYGVIAYSVSHRRREIGVRMALGAEPASVVGSVFREAALVAGSGLVVGFCVVLGAGRVLEGVLYAVAPTDPVRTVGSAVLLATVAAVAAWIPARRAARIAPTEALRSE